MPPPIALLASPDDTELQFYEALRLGDIEQLMAVWADEDEIVCVHPGGTRLVGAPAIRAAFGALFANGALDVRPERVRRVVTVSSAVHSLVECVQVRTAEGIRTAYVTATNVYIKTTQGWRLAAHHASPGSVNDLADIGEAPAVLH